MTAARPGSETRRGPAPNGGLRTSLAGPTLALCCLLHGLPAAAAAEEGGMMRLATSSGIPFGMIGAKGATPAPVLFVFAGGAEETLAPGFYPLAETMRRERGFLLAAVDIPGHGGDRRPDEPASIPAWRTRLEKGENAVAAYIAKVSAVLDYLISEGYADPARVVAAGTSRGGFMAFHFAAADHRVRAVAAFAPVTELLALREFSGLWNHALTRSLAAHHLAARLANRPVWMCIGNNDDRVDTDQAITFSRRVVEAARAQGKRPDIEVWLQTSEGHGIAADSHPRAAAWLMQRYDAGWQ